MTLHADLRHFPVVKHSSNCEVEANFVIQRFNLCREGMASSFRYSHRDRYSVDEIL